MIESENLTISFRFFMPFLFSIFEIIIEFLPIIFLNFKTLSLLSANEREKCLTPSFLDSLIALKSLVVIGLSSIFLFRSTPLLLPTIPSDNTFESQVVLFFLFKFYLRLC